MMGDETLLTPIGIDLGTTNCVLAFGRGTACRAPTRGSAYASSGGSDGDIEVFDCPQLISLGEVGTRRLLPSFIYFPTEAERESGELRLPWDPIGERVVGEFARRRGAEIRGRLVYSSKSWLSFTAVDRTKPILPHDGAEDCPKISPVVAAATFLRHLKSAWNHSMARELGELNDLECTVTIPASFDAVARELTLKAAQSAGLEGVTLLEEPQAAFYAWLYYHREDWEELIGPGDVVLVVDIGGGTTDFSLIQVKAEGDQLGLERIAVGRHLLLGGDNMDLALTESVLNEMPEAHRSFSRRQYNLVVQNVRQAKEALLKDQGLEEATFSIPGPGRGLVGGTIRCEIKRRTLESIIMDGFFPECSMDDHPLDEPVSGLMELTLPYEKDSAITRHLARFLNENPANLPTHILFNGGVLKARSIRGRIVGLLDSWFKAQGREGIKVLEPVDLDISVAIGATAFSYAKRGELWRIKAGVPKTYYMGIERSGPAIPGVPPRLMALCLCPEGAEEGSEFAIDRQFGLVVGKLVKFPFLVSSTRVDDTPGGLIYEPGPDIEPISTLEAQLDAPGIEPGSVIPVKLKVKVTEVGTIEIYLVSEEKGVSFKMEFGVRE